LGSHYDDVERYDMIRLGVNHLLKKISKKRSRAAQAIRAGFLAYDFTRKAYRKQNHINIHVHMVVQVDLDSQELVSDWIESIWCNYTAAEIVEIKPVEPRGNGGMKDALGKIFRYIMEPYEIDDFHDLIRVQQMTHKRRRMRFFGSFALS